MAARKNRESRISGFSEDSKSGRCISPLTPILRAKKRNRTVIIFLMPLQHPQSPLQKRLSVSTWSLHHHLGAPPISGPQSEIAPFETQKLLALPAQIAAFGIGTLEICHFHLPSRDAVFLAEMRSELERNGIELWAFLIDDGDLNDAQNAARDAKWMASWLPIASQLGAKNARVIAGKGAPTPENQAQSIAALQDLAGQAEALGLRLLTENWFDMTATPAATLQILDALDGKLGLMMDFGNWKGDEKYADLAQIAPHAESCHTKAAFHNGQIEREDYVKCLEITKAANFAGPYTLIYDSGGGEWGGLERERGVVMPYLG